MKALGESLDCALLRILAGLDKPVTAQEIAHLRNLEIAGQGVITLNFIELVLGRLAAEGKVVRVGRDRFKLA